MLQSISPPALAESGSRPGSALARTALAALAGGLLAGTIDIFAAALINQRSPLIILRAIASGLYGKAAFTGPESIEAIGLGLQWAMSILIAAIYAGAALRLKGLVRRPVRWGLAYGVGICVVMNCVVYPLSNAPPLKHVTLLWTVESLLAMLLFGLIVALVSSRLMGGASKT